MNNQRILRLALIGVGLIIGALLVRVGMEWFFSNFERVTYEDRGGFLPEAQRNPLLAAERYLKHVGAEVESLNTADLWRDLPDPGDAIIIYRYTPPAGRDRRQALRSWVEEGGHLIVAADDSVLVDTDEFGAGGVSPAGENNLLSELGVSVYRDDSDFGFEQLMGNEPVEVELSNFKEKISVDFRTLRYLLVDEYGAEPMEAVPCGNGYCLLQFDVGRGLVTVVSDIRFINNKNIGDNDHALVLALLYPDPPRRTWLIYDVDMPSLLELMWDRLPYALSALLLALLLWMWQKGGRLGPALPPLQQPRRSIDEHLRASAGFLWRIDRGRQLFLSNQRALKQAWFAKHFVLRSMPRSESCAWIAARAGLSQEAVKRALYDPCGSEQEYIELSSFLQILRMAL